MRKMKIWLSLCASVLVIMAAGCSGGEVQIGQHETETVSVSDGQADWDAIPAYSGSPYVVLNENIPNFSEEDFTNQSYENYEDLDELGRCGVAEANVGTDLMPTEKRGSIGKVKPTGWQTAKYDHVDGNYLYNRCHLIGYQLSGENANERNLITGTRYLNVDGMLPFENMVADYVKETGNHVLYRVTPIFDGSNLVASGVVMEAESVEDRGESILFHVFVYNVQPGIVIDYATGESWEGENGQTGPIPGVNSATLHFVGDKLEDSEVKQEYVVNTNTKKFHKPSCSSVGQIQKENRKTVKKTRKDMISQGYEPCGRCHP